MCLATHIHNEGGGGGRHRRAIGIIRSVIDDVVQQFDSDLGVDGVGNSQPDALAQGAQRTLLLTEIHDVATLCRLFPVFLRQK